MTLLEISHFIDHQLESLDGACLELCVVLGPLVFPDCKCLSQCSSDTFNGIFALSIVNINLQLNHLICEVQWLGQLCNNIDLCWLDTSHCTANVAKTCGWSVDELMMDLPFLVLNLL